MKKAEDLTKQKFWAEFSKKYWEKSPVAFKRPASPVFEISDQDIFNFLLCYSDHCRKNNTTEGLKLYVDDQLQYEQELLEALPVAKDKSLAGYHKRLKKVYDDYCLVCDELIKGVGNKWHVIKEFVEPLYQEFGIPNKYAEIGLYLGNYKKTPFGVHVDGCGVFSFPVVGTKKFRLWDPKFVENNPDLKESFSYESYKKNSTLLEVGPKDMAYWPSKAWHIAESDGAFTATWSIGLWLDKPFSELIANDLKPLLSDKRTVKLKNIFGEEKLPDQYIEAVSRINKLSKEDLEDTFMRSWLIIKSKQGFKSAPLPLSGFKIKPSDKLVAVSKNSLVWARLNCGLICLAINGLLFELRKTEILLKLIQLIDSGKVFTIDNMDKELSKIVEALYANYVVVNEE